MELISKYYILKSLCLSVSLRIGHLLIWPIEPLDYKAMGVYMELFGISHGAHWISKFLCEPHSILPKGYDYWVICELQNLLLPNIT